MGFALGPKGQIFSPPGPIGLRGAPRNDQSIRFVSGDVIGNRGFTHPAMGSHGICLSTFPKPVGAPGRMVGKSEKRAALGFSLNEALF